MSKLYSPLEIRAAYQAWATLSRELFKSEDDWIRARRELWHTYCDARDNRTHGISRAIEDAVKEDPAIKLVQ